LPGLSKARGDRISTCSAAIALAITPITHSSMSQSTGRI
jgi:hypothetical protein